MTKKTQASTNAKNGLGPVAREKYEAILKERVRQCITVQETKVKAQRAKALKVYLERNGLAGTLRQYRTALEALIAVLGEPYYRELWLRNDETLLQNTHVQEGVEGVLRGMKELKPVYAEIERLRRYESQIAERVWLAGAPSEIAELLKEIGEPPADVLNEDTA